MIPQAMSKGQTPHHYSFGGYRLDLRERLLCGDQGVVSLTPKAFDTLLVLVENSGHVLSKDELMAKVWPDSFVEENNLAQNISALRKALGEEKSSQKYIETVPKRGYRFVAVVRENFESPGTGQKHKERQAGGHERAQPEKGQPFLRDVVFIGRAINFK
jgi:DNA-binding winged helix-turn-helix (wHTH) protein